MARTESAENICWCVAGIWVIIRRLFQGSALKLMNNNLPDRAALERLAKRHGFDDVGVSDVDLEVHEARLERFLASGLHGSMHYLQKHFPMRARPAQLLPGALRVISVRMDYLTEPNESLAAKLDHPVKAYISRYALGRDYHKLIRKRLQRLATALSDEIGSFGYRACVDSAPVMEKPLAEKAGLGWIGKHTNLINKRAGSWFFLGEILTDLPLETDQIASDHCGSCTRCIEVCPTQAIVAPYQLDARRCISYLTIENRGVIPEEFRRPMGNRIYGCDDCQIFCPWNKFASLASEVDFKARNNLDSAALTSLFAWEEHEFLSRTEGSPIRRTGFLGWLRNIAVALGNAAYHETIVEALQARVDHPSELVREHVIWALAEQRIKKNQTHV